MNNIFVKETDVYYLWSGFGKKLESLDSAGVVAQRVEAFDVSGLCTLGRNFSRDVIGSGQMAATTAGRVIFFRGTFFFSFSFKLFPRLFRFLFLFFL